MGKNAFIDVSGQDIIILNRILFDNTPDAVLFTIPDGTVLAANPAACRLFGRSEKDICKIGRNGLVDPADTRLADGLKKRLDKSYYVAEYNHVKSDGTRFPAEVTSILFHTDNGQPRMMLIIRDITKEKKSEDMFTRNEALLRNLFDLFKLAENPEKTESEFMNNAIEAVKKFTKSQIAFIGLMNDDESVLSIHSWSKEVMEQCNIEESSLHFPVAGAGLWGELIRQRKPILVNEYKASGMKKGYPAGHIDLKRFLGVPIFHEGKIVAIGAVANKDTEYDERDLNAVTVTLHEMWNLIESKRKEQSIRESEERFRLIVNSMDDIVYTLDTEMRHTGVYGTWLNRFGFSPDNVLGKTIWEAFGEKSRVISEDYIKKALNGETITFEWNETRNSITYYHQTLLYPMKNEKGRVIGVFGLGRDITRQKQTELAITEEAERRRILMERSRDGIVILDENGYVIEANQHFAEMHGYTVEEARKLHIKDWIPEFVDIRKVLSEVDTTGDHIESQHRRKNSTVFDAEISINSATIKGQRHIFCICRDISERKKAEQSLRESEAFNASLLDASPYPINVINPDASIRYVNPALEKLTGYSAEELIGQKPPYPYWGEEEMVKESVKRFQLAMAEGISGRERRFIKKNGEEFWVRLTNTPVKTNSRVSYILTNWIDITETRKAETAIKENEERYRSLVNNISLGIFRSTPDLRGRFVEINKAMEEITGYSREELLTIDIIDIFEDPEERKSVHIDFSNARNGITREVHLKKKDDSVILVADTKVPVRNSRGKIMYFDGIIEDITQRRKIEEENQRITRIESLGVLAGGIVHDFNNLLTGIMGNISLAMTDIKENTELLKSLKAAEKATEQASSLTQQLLTFSRGGTPVIQTIEIAALIEESARFAMRGSGNKIEFSLPDNLSPVEADEGQINQVITNLVINACEAMPEGGLIKIQAENEDFRENPILPLTAGKYVKITVEDNGTGIENQHLTRLFDPYFTTKPGGTGLGLPSTYSIIKRHGGHVTVESKPGSGSRFTVYIPASDKRPEKVEAAETPVTPAPAGGKILVMDDEKNLREVLGRILEKLGYSIQLTSDGAAAVKAYIEAMKKGEPFDAVILDLTIPGGMGGMETIEKLRELDPGVKAIMSSGYANGPGTSDYKKHGFKATVNKPYNITRMKQALQKLLA